MDKYLIKTPRVPQERAPAKKKSPKRKQVTIESLSRVVVVEKIHQAKSILSVENQRLDEIVNTLKELDKCTPSKEVLLETKIGHIVNKLRKHEAESVKELATKILTRWKLFYRQLRQRQPLDVKCDAKTEQFRKKARKLLSEALNVDEDSPLSESIERTVYLSTDRRTNFGYRKLIRNLHMKLKNKKDLRDAVLEKTLTPNELCQRIT